MEYMVSEKNDQKVQTLRHLMSSSCRAVNGADLAFGSCQEEQTGSGKGRAPLQGMNTFLDLKSVLRQSLSQGGWKSSVLCVS
jgi:hypothetical protein